MCFLLVENRALSCIFTVNIKKKTREIEREEEEEEEVKSENDTLAFHAKLKHKSYTRFKKVFFLKTMT